MVRLVEVASMARSGHTHTAGWPGFRAERGGTFAERRLRRNDYKVAQDHFPVTLGELRTRSSDVLWMALKKYIYIINLKY